MLKRIPDLIIVLHAGNPNARIVLNEARKIRVPSICIADSNLNSRAKNITYLVPGNDDSIGAALIYIKLLLRAHDIGILSRFYTFLEPI